MKFKPTYILLCSFLCLIVSACSSEEMPPEGKSHEKGYEFTARIEEFDALSTRVLVDDELGDGWSYSKFSAGDVSGFYSLYGNADSPGGNGRFDNEPMYYGKDTFYNFDINYNAESFVEKSTFYYFPYCEYIDYDESHTDYTGDNYGLELRVYDPSDGIYKCRDFLWIFGATRALGNQSFSHAFSSIVFIGGEGFKNATKKPIKVVLDKGVSHVTVGPPSDTYLKDTKLLYLRDYPLGEDKCKVWEAWRAHPYQVTKEDPVYGSLIFEDVAYVVLPTTRSNRLNVDHIEAYDDDDNLRIITNFTLYTSGNNGKILQRGQRYPVMLKMQGLEPTISPIGIENWGENHEIHEERAPGIESVNDFNDWLMYYNTYLENGRLSAYDSYLEKYGDKTESGTSTSWKFYINNDLDLKDYSEDTDSGNKNYIISYMDDTLEGNDHNISGLKVNFIRELSSSGVISNLDFRGLYIISTSEDEKIGGLLGICKGTLENCLIDGVISGAGPVGMIAAEAEEAVINRVTLRGFMVGRATFNGGMFAQQATECTFVNNNTSGLIFQQSN